MESGWVEGGGWRMGGWREGNGGWEGGQRDDLGVGVATGYWGGGGGMNECVGR